MGAGLARWVRQPGKQNEFVLYLHEKIHPACWHSFVLIIDIILIADLNSASHTASLNCHPGNRANPLAGVYMEIFSSR
jgi:hypothetical protein